MKHDAKAFKIIKAQYWKNGWREPEQRVLSPADQTYLSTQGLLFGRVVKTHDEIIAEVKTRGSAIPIDRCLGLLSRSLPTRSLKDRSYASSALLAKQMPEHTYAGTDRCPVCGLYANAERDFGVLLFEKIMWGGVRFDHPDYILLDLTLFVEEADADSETGDLDAFLDHLARHPHSLSASKTAQVIPLEKGNKAERENLCDILGIFGILAHPDHRGFAEGWVDSSERRLPDQHFIDLAWPFCWYNGRYGVDMRAFAKLKRL